MIGEIWMTEASHNKYQISVLSLPPDRKPLILGDQSIDNSINPSVIRRLTCDDLVGRQPLVLWSLFLGPPPSLRRVWELGFILLLIDPVG